MLVTSSKCLVQTLQLARRGDPSQLNSELEVGISAAELPCWPEADFTPQVRLEGKSPLELPGLAVVLSGNFPKHSKKTNFT
jgi:hypothetical protein